MGLVRVFLTGGWYLVWFRDIGCVLLSAGSGLPEERRCLKPVLLE